MKYRTPGRMSRSMIRSRQIRCQTVLLVGAAGPTRTRPTAAGAPAGDHVHRAADAATDLFGRVPVGHVARLVDLVGAEHDDVDLAGAHHLERGHAVEVGHAWPGGDVIAAGV